MFTFVFHFFSRFQNFFGLCMKIGKNRIFLKILENDDFFQLHRKTDSFREKKSPLIYVNADTFEGGQLEPF